MSSVIDFPIYAAACLRMAREEDTMRRRAELLELADTWLRLYEEHRRDLSNPEVRERIAEAFEPSVSPPTLH
ncbi:MAG TPA: hypothetical protein VHA77_15840 [Xanthobacteraceae bacterium]|jgi:hypothetical protein|nr:hypothetical protein [Xanthobacteraceae bacterium]